MSPSVTSHGCTGSDPPIDVDATDALYCVRQELLLVTYHHSGELVKAPAENQKAREVGSTLDAAARRDILTGHQKKGIKFVMQKKLTHMGTQWQ